MSVLSPCCQCVHTRLHRATESQLFCLHNSVRPSRTAHKQRLPNQVHAAAGGSRNASTQDDVDVSVFRFTLGIPGFDDKYIPRVIGILSAVLLTVNHVFGAQPPPAAQGTSEVVGVCLAALAVVVPWVEERLSEAQPGKGRAAAAEAVQGGVNTFALAPGLADDAKKELAWASFSLLKNTNSCSVLVWRPEEGVLLARGAFKRQAASKEAAAVVAELSQGMASVSQLSAATKVLQATPGTAESTAYWPDAGTVASAGLSRVSLVPEGAEGALLQQLPAGRQQKKPGLVLVLCDRPRALSGRERGWVDALAVKLAAWV